MSEAKELSFLQQAHNVEIARQAANEEWTRFREMIRDLIDNEGYTQAHVAQLWGVSNSRVGQVYHNKRAPRESVRVLDARNTNGAVPVREEV